MVEIASAPTPLHDIHVALGATMTDFAGWLMPLRYGSETAEHQAVRSTAGLFDLSHMGEIDVSGPDAASALNYAFVSDIGGIAVGKAKYTMICNSDGGILDDLVVYRLSEARFLVVANAGNVAVVYGALCERTANFDAEVRDQSAVWALVALQGPVAASVVERITHDPIADLRYYAIREARVARRPVLLARTGYTGEDGFELFCAPSDAEQLWTALSSAGAGDGVIPAGLACRDSLRLEAGMPLYGHELRIDLTPFDAGLGRVVRVGAVDYVGGAALTKKAGTAPPRRLVGVVCTARRIPRAGYSISSDSGEVIGEVTSGGFSPILGQPVAMAYVDRDFAHTDAVVQIDIRGAWQPGTVIDLPFYRRPR